MLVFFPTTNSTTVYKKGTIFGVRPRPRRSIENMRVWNIFVVLSLTVSSLFHIIKNSDSGEPSYNTKSGADLGREEGTGGTCLLPIFS